MRENPIAEHELYKVARCDPTEYRGVPNLSTPEYPGVPKPSTPDYPGVPWSTPEYPDTLSTESSRAFLRRFTLPVAATSLAAASHARTDARQR
jgi:hypothetical protein